MISSGVSHAFAEAERLEPGAAGELARVRPQRAGLLVGVADDDVAQHAHALALLLARDLGIDAVELVLEDRQHRRQDRRHVLLRAEAHGALRAGEGLEQRRVRLLQRLGHHADRLQDAVLDALAPLLRRVERPRRLAHRHLPERAVDGQHLLRPAFLDDAEVLLEGETVRVVDLVVLVRQRAVNAVRLLRHDIYPAPLVAAREPRIGAAAGHVVEHGDVFGHADRVRRRQHDAELSDPDALGLHREVEIEQHRIVRELETLDVEVMLGERHRIVAQLVAQLYLLGQLFQHALIKLRVHARHALLDLGTAGDRRQIEERGFHSCFLRFMRRRVARFQEGGRLPGKRLTLQCETDWRYAGAHLRPCRAACPPPKGRRTRLRGPKRRSAHRMSRNRSARPTSRHSSGCPCRS